MNLAPVTRSFKFSFAVAGLAFLAAALVLFLVASSRIKAVVAVLGGLTILTGAFLSGNPRLFSLWGLMLTIPFDLSKRFGPIIEKMGGESSFRIEMSDPFVLMLLAFLARDIWSGYRKGLRVPRAAFYWVLIMLMGCFAFVVGPWRTTAAHEVVRMFKMMLLFLVVTNELQRPRRVLHCAAGLTLGVIVQAAAGLIQYFTRSHFGLELLGETGAGTMSQLMADSVRTEKVHRIGAFLSHPNVFGIFLAALLPVAVGAFLLRVGKAYKLLFFAGIVLGMAALIGTLSRSGWLSFAAAFTLLVLLMTLHHGLRRRSLITMMLAAAALLIVCVAFAGPITRRIFESRKSAMLSRADYISDARGMISAKPILGWGLNSYVYAAPPFTKYGAREAHKKYENWLPPVHNIYLLWWAETGLVGLVIHLLVLGSIITVGVGNLRVKDELLFAINAACLSAMLAFVVDGFFSFSLRINSILRVFWVLAGIIMAVRYWRLGHERRTERDR